MGRAIELGKITGTAPELCEWDSQLDAVKQMLRMKDERIAELEKERDHLKLELNMYTKAWIRELGGRLINKSHQIDALVLTTRKLKEDTRRNVLLSCAREIDATVTRCDVVGLKERWKALAKEAT